ncbi:MAG: MarR family transcriptional regulator [candidate division Zixibacteria bacterium]|nr:MarR family transcriptional regulator [candidate division Zixibacteria bacterium]
MTDIKKQKDIIENRFGRVLGMTAKAMKQFLNRKLIESGYDLTFEQAVIIAHSLLDDGLNQQQIADMIDRDKTSTTRFIDILEERKLVARVPDKDDRRQNIIRLTKDGEKRCQEFMRIAGEAHEEMLKEIDPADIEVCKDVLRKVYRNISD